MEMKSSKPIILIVLIILVVSSFLSPSIASREEVISEPAPTRSISESSVSYLIITTSDLKGSFEPLAQWRSQMGLKSSIYSIDEITSSGDDDAEVIFNFISEKHSSSNGELQYVLLGGDSDLIATRYLHANASKFGLDDQYLSDVYYASPGLDWDLDGDKVYGEREDIEGIGIENISFPIKVGRSPVKTIQEADLFVQRVIEYETSPPEGDWFDKGIISSSVMDTPNRIDDPGTPTDEGYSSYKDNGYKAIENYTMAYVPRSLDIIHAHDYTSYEGGEYSGINDTLKEDTLPTLISNGSAFFTFAGQSFYDVEYPVSPLLAYSLAHWFDDTGTATPPSLGFQPGLSHKDTVNLTNGGMLPVVYISSCDSANFSDPDEFDLSNMVIAPNGGAICMIGSTGISWRGEGEDYSLGNWYLMSRFWQNYMSTNRPGDSLYALKEQYLEQKWDEIASKEPLLVGLYAYNYLGDPALRSWLGQPGELTIQTSGDSIYAGGDELGLSVRDRLGTPLAGAVVTLYNKVSDMVFTSTTGPDGTIQAWSQFPTGGTAVLTITHKNYLPRFMNITILDEPADVMVDQDSISYSPNRPSEGAVLNISATIRNMGGRDLTGVTISLFSEEILDPGSPLPPSLGDKTIDLPVGGSMDVYFDIDPLRSWDGIWIVAVPQMDEVQIDNNIGSIVIPINARPRFLPSQYFELEEDPAGPVFFDLVPSVFDPDMTSLNFSLQEGVPTWITLDPNGTLEVSPPTNWTGIITVGVKVSDGLSYDMAEIDLFISSKNDAPALLQLKPIYHAVVDSPFTMRLDMIDAEGDEVDVKIISDLEKLTFSGNVVRFVPYPEDIGTYEVRLLLTDAFGANRSYTFTIVVTGPSEKLYFTEPSVHLPTAYVDKDYSYTINVGGDLSNNTKFSSNSSWINIDEDTGEITFSPDGSRKGEHWVKITITSGNVTISRSFILDVEDEKGIIPNSVFWALGIGIILLLAIIIGLYLWSGPSIQQYGLEE